MQTVVGIICAVAAVALVIVAKIYRKKVFSEEYNNFLEKPDSYTAVIQTKDGKKIITGLILNIAFVEENISSADLSPENFTVHGNTKTVSEVDNKKNPDDVADVAVVAVVADVAENTDCKISGVCFCDIDGNKMSFDSDEENDATHLLLSFESDSIVEENGTERLFEITSKLFSKTIKDYNSPLTINHYPQGRSLGQMS